MKIAYVAQLEMDGESGVNKKIVDQIGTWRSAGHETALFVMSRARDLWAGWGEVAPSVFRYSSGLSRLSASRELVRKVSRWSPDVIYYRMAVPYPAFITLARRTCLVVEVNSDDYREARVRMGWVKYKLYSTAIGKLMARAAGAVSASRAVGESLRDDGHEVLVLGNGIDLSRIRASPPPHNPEPRLLFLGSVGCSWHGVDKLRMLALSYPRWRFDIVGLRQEDAGGSFPANVIFHGFLGRDQYEPLLNEADVAIGTLALHRKGMGDASALKVREYLAAGLPIILGHPDIDFEGDLPYILQLPNVESNVRDNLSRIEEFVAQWRGRRVNRKCVEHLDVRFKEALRLEFLAARVLATGRARAS